MGGMEMKLLTLDNKGEKQLGVKVGDVVVNVPNALKEKPKQSVAATMETLIEQGEAGLQALEAYVDEVKSDQATYIWKEQDVDFAAAITRPRKIICVGLNYRKHADETKAKYPEVPVLFNKLDHEVGLGIVIGKTAKHVKKEHALDYVFGYCTTNDLSARDIQKRASQWMTGKTNDGFAPVGPYIVTKDDIPNPDELQLTTKVNGETRQNSNTRDMIF